MTISLVKKLSFLILHILTIGAAVLVPVIGKYFITSFDRLESTQQNSHTVVGILNLYIYHLPLRAVVIAKRGVAIQQS